MLRVESISKSYPRATREALHDVSFQVERGSVCCLIGRNGAGKSTLMSSIVNLTPLTSGRITLDGDDLPGSQSLRRRVGFAAQADALYPLLSGRENLTTFGRLAGLAASAIATRIDELSHRLRIGDLLDRPVRELSGGERRRVHVAAALIGDVDVVMLDEPTAGVDPITRTNVLELVREVAARGAMVVYSTHYLPEVERIDDEVVMLELGRVVGSGSLRTLLSRHTSVHVEMEFARAVDVSSLTWPFEWHGQSLRVEVQRPSDELPQLLHALGDDTTALRSLDVVEPSLERVFMDLTGRGIETPDDAPVGAEGRRSDR